MSQQSDVAIEQEEVVHPQEDNNVQEALAPVTEGAPQNEESKESSKEYNFRQLEKSRDELARRVQELESYVQQSQQPQSQASSAEEEADIAPDDLVEGKHLKREIKRLESQLQGYQAMSIEGRLRSQYQDFDSVVTKENIEKLKETEPELASTLFASQDLYSKGVAAYKLLKNLGYGPNPQTEMNKERVAQNAAKPRSASQAGGQFGQSPISQAGAYQQGLTPELRQQLLKEMNDARRAY